MNPLCAKFPLFSASFLENSRLIGGMFVIVGERTGASSVGGRGGSRIFPREGRLVQRGGIFRVGGRRDLTWAPYPYPISYLYTYEYVISRNINSIDLR